MWDHLRGSRRPRRPRLATDLLPAPARRYCGQAEAGRRPRQIFATTHESRRDPGPTSGTSGPSNLLRSLQGCVEIEILDSTSDRFESRPLRQILRSLQHAIACAAARDRGRSRQDLLGEDAPLGGSDLDVELALEIHPEQAIDVVVAEVENVDREACYRVSEGGELGYMQEVSLLCSHRCVNPSPIDTNARAVPPPRGPATNVSTMISSPWRTNGVSSLVIEDQRWAHEQPVCPSREVAPDFIVTPSP